jgi:hypothetical protein
MLGKERLQFFEGLVGWRPASGQHAHVAIGRWPQSCPQEASLPLLCIFVAWWLTSPRVSYWRGTMRSWSQKSHTISFTTLQVSPACAQGGRNYAVPFEGRVGCSGSRWVAISVTREAEKRGLPFENQPRQKKKLERCPSQQQAGHGGEYL